ncbi:hypothetical protein HELRODRAFT_175838 [Helobdella robusta]|uniref:Endonuclease/exonuclease/phosphatase domain-containing protein n=1 Tax=Helobdella robusta TaxID=6412 RepID=T1F9R0_HELRO|nr:hypothetical protein HELRODRAFT_175838 [Helobdella robusta]ESO00417.1 hypothetical protein HELRODRAFT_175838 [Helobdella robusta]
MWYGKFYCKDILCEVLPQLKIAEELCINKDNKYNVKNIQKPLMLGCTGRGASPGTFDPKARCTAYNSALLGTRSTAIALPRLLPEKTRGVAENRASPPGISDLALQILDAQRRSSTCWKGKGLTSVLCRKQDGNQMVSLSLRLTSCSGMAKRQPKMEWESSELKCTEGDSNQLTPNADQTQNGKQVLTVFSAYAPETGESEDAKNDFWNTLSDTVRKTPSSEIPLICGDLNGHVGDKANGFHGVHEGFGYGPQNEDGVRILEFAESHELSLLNTYLKKRAEHLITYVWWNFKGVTFLSFYQITQQLIRKSTVVSWTN